MAKKTGYKKTPTKINNLIALFRANGGNVSATCVAAQISRKTFYNWVNDDPELAEVVEEVKEECFPVTIHKPLHFK